MENAVYMKKEDFLLQNEALNTNLKCLENVSVLSKELEIGNKRIPNRLACQAMEGCDATAQGCVGELTKRRYARFARGGAGLIWFEATAVMKEGRANPHQLYIDENTVDSFKRQVEEIKQTALRENGYEPLVVMQATHSGRYSKPNGVPEPLIAYNNPILEQDTPIDSSRIVSDEYLDSVRDALVNGARLAEKAGFDGVDIKCCHRYLNSELLSAYERKGRYGGSFENRTRLLIESVEGAMQSCGSDFLVSTRMNAYDGYVYPYGFGVKEGNGTEFDAQEAIMIVKELQKRGVKMVNVTMGNPYFNPHVNRPYAHGAYEPPEHPLCGVSRMLNGTAQIKKAVPDMKMICSGVSYLGVAAPYVVSAYIENGDFDIAGFGRTVFAYPDFANDIMKSGEMKKEKCCIACSKCTQIMRQKGGTPGCVIRDREVYLPIYQNFFGGKK